MPKLLKTEIASWVRKRFTSSVAFCDYFQVTTNTANSWKKNPPLWLVQYKNMYEKNIELQETIFDLKNELNSYKIAHGIDLIERNKLPEKIK